MIGTYSLDLPLRIAGEGYYQVLYGNPEFGQDWAVDGIIGPPHDSIESTFTVQPNPGSDFEDGLVVSSVLALRLGATVVFDWGKEPPIVVTRLSMQESQSLNASERSRVSARLELIRGVGALTMHEKLLIGQMTKNGLEIIAENQ